MGIYTDSAGILRDTNGVSPGTDGLNVNTTLTTLATNRSALVGTASQELMPANSARKGYSLQNQSASATVYIRVGAAATADQNALRLNPGAYFETNNHVGLAAINAISTAANTQLFAREW